MSITRIKNNQITDASAGNVYLGVNAASKVQDYSITSAKIANNLTYNSSLTITGNLTVQGNSTVIDTTNLTVEDPIIILASEQIGPPALDIGFIGERGTSQNITFVWDESAGEFVTAFTNDTVTNTTVTIASYANFHTNDANIGGNIVVNGTSTFVGNILGNLAVTGNFSAGSIATAGVVNATGNITGGNLVSNAAVSAATVSATGNITGGNVISNAAVVATGNITTTAGNILGGNIATTGVFNATGNITGGNLLANTAIIAVGNITTTAGNILGGNIATTGVINATGNIRGGNLLSNASVSAVTTISANGNITGGNLVSNAAVSAVTTISANGNITGGNLISNAAVIATGNISGGNISTGGLINATGNITGGNLVSNAAISAATTISANGNITGGNVISNAAISADTTITATGNITGGNVISNAAISAATTITATGNITGGNLISNAAIVATGNITTATGNILGGNIATTGVIDATGNIRGGNLVSNSAITGTTLTTTGNASVGNLSTAGNITATGNIQGGNLISNGAVIGNVTITGNLALGNLSVSGQINTTGNITGGNLVSNAAVVASGNITTATGNISGGNISTGGQINATGNIRGGNLLSNASISAVTTVSANGNITGGNVISNAAISAATTITATGNITGGNLISNAAVVAGGNITTTTGNISGANLIATSNVVAPNIVTSTVTTSSGDLFLNSASGVLQWDGTGNIVMNNQWINNLSDPVQAQDAATKEYVDNAVSSGITIHTPVRLEANSAVNGTYAQGGTTATVTQTIAGNTVVFSSAVNPQVNDQYWFTNSFQGILGNTPYFVVSAPNTSSAVLSRTWNGAPVTNITSAGSLTQPVRINSGQGATLTNAGANATLVIDGVTVNTNDRVLIYSQANAVHNGVYVVSNAGNATTAWQLTRSSDMNTYKPDDVNGLDAGDYFYVQAGDSGAGESYVMTAPVGPVIIGYDQLTFTQFSASQVYSANTSAGLSLSGTVFSAKVDNNTTAFDGGGNISVKAGANLTTPNIGAATGTSLSVTGNVTAGNLTSNAAIVATGNITTTTGNIFGGNIATSGQINATGNIRGGNLLSNASISAVTTISANGNITGGNLVSNAAISAATTISATGNITGGNVISNAAVVATGNITTTAGNILGGNIATTGVFNATGNITGGNLVSNAAVVATGNITTATGNILGGNIATTGQINANGNITGGNLVSNAAISAATTITATGNITGGNLISNAAISAATTITATGNITGGNLISNAAISAATTITATGNITGGNLISNAAIVATGNITTTAGNILGGNIATTGVIDATGNITGGNVISNALVSGANVRVTSLTANRVVYVGANNTLVDSANFTYNGTTANIQGALIIDNFTIDGTVIASNANASITSASNGNIALTPNGTGNVVIDNIAISDNSIYSVTGNIVLDPAATGNVILNDELANAILFTGPAKQIDTSSNFTYNGTQANLVGNLNVQGVIVLDNFTIDGTVITSNANATITSSSNGNIAITPNGTGNVVIDNIAISDNTIYSVSGNIVLDPAAAGNVILTDELANAVVFTGPGKQIDTVSNFTFDGANLVLVGKATIDNVIVDGNTINTDTNRLNINSTLADADFSVSGTAANIFYIDAGLGTASFGNATQTVNALVAFNASNSILIPTGNSAQRPAVGVTGMIRFNTTLDTLEFYNTDSWTTAGTQFTLIDSQVFNGDGSTVTYTLNSDQTTDSCIVSINGVVQIPVLAYSVAGNVLTFTEAPLVSDTIEVRQLTTTTAIKAIANSTGNAAVEVQDTSNDVSITGDLVPTANVTFDLGSPALRWRDGYFAGNSIYLGNLVLKNTTGNTLAFFGPDGTTPGTLDSTNVDTTTIANGTANVKTFSTGNVVTISAGGNANVVVVANGSATFNADLLNGQANGVGNIGNSTTYFNTVFAKATSAQYADLAEMYAADADYDPGTVVCFGGTKEVTLCDVENCKRVAGVISTNPSYLMNSALEGEYVLAVALTGRVPCRVQGPVAKGDLMVSAGNGFAMANNDAAVGTVIGKALQDFDGDEGMIEVVVGRV